MIPDVVEQLREQLPAGSEQLRADLGGRRRVVYLGSRWAGRGVYAVFTDRTSTPAVVVKVDFLSRQQHRLRAEWDALNVISQHECLDGRVPRPLALFPVDDGLVLAQSGLPGVPMSVVLRRRLRPGVRSSERDHRMVVEWLGRLHATSTTAATTTIDPDAVVDRVARAVGSPDRDSRPALERFASVAAAIGPLTVPLRPQHGDLGPSNYLVSRGRISVIDWEAGLTAGSPLAELLVFLAQYARAVPGRGQTLLGPIRSFDRTFLSDDWLAQLTARTWAHEMAGLGLAAETTDYLLAAAMADLTVAGGTSAHSWNANWRSAWAARLTTYLDRGPFGVARRP